MWKFKNKNLKEVEKLKYELIRQERKNKLWRDVLVNHLSQISKLKTKLNDCEEQV